MTRDFPIKSDYEAKVVKLVEEKGGFFNAHAHMDRAFTFKDKYYQHKGRSVEDISHGSLKEKQDNVYALQIGPAFSNKSLEKRMRRFLEDSIKFGITRVDSSIDVTHHIGLKSMEVASKLREDYKDRIDLRLGAYNVSGFKDSHEERFRIFEDATKEADFIVGLAEKDRKEGHIGEREQNVYLLELGINQNKPVHFHVGQENSPNERGAETLFECMHWVYDVTHRFKKYPGGNRLVHDISAASYSEEDFKTHCENLKKYNLGVICCPSAGISMRTDRNINVPNHNSLAPIWDFLIRDIPVFFGGDNTNDVFVPSSTPDMFDEFYMLTNGLRGYSPNVIASLAAGEGILDNHGKGRVRHYVQFDSSKKFFD